MAVRPGPGKPDGPGQPGTAPAAPPPGRRMAEAHCHRRQLSIPALLQAGGAAGTQPGRRGAGHPAGPLVPALPAPAPRRPQPPAPCRGRLEESGQRTPPGLQLRRVPAELPGPSQLCVPAHHRQPEAQATLPVPAGHRGSPRFPRAPGRRAATGWVRSAATRLVDPAGAPRSDPASGPGPRHRPCRAVPV